MPFVNHAAFEEGMRQQQSTSYKLYPHQSTEQEDYQVLSENIPSLFEEDVRMIQNRKEIPFWIEEKGEAWTKINKLFVNTPQLLFALSGHHSAKSDSSGDDTFDFFDDFLGSSLDGTKWESVGSPTISISNSIMNLFDTDASTLSYIKSKNLTFSDPIIIEIYHRDHSEEIYPFEFGFGAGVTNAIRKARYGSDLYMLDCFKDSSRSYSDSGIAVDNTYRIFKLVWKDGNAKLYKENVEIASVVTNIPTVDLFYAMGSLHASGSSGNDLEGSVDWVFIRKYASSEPLVLKQRTKGKSDTIKAIVAGLVA